MAFNDLGKGGKLLNKIQIPKTSVIHSISNFFIQVTHDIGSRTDSKDPKKGNICYRMRIKRNNSDTFSQNQSSGSRVKR